uniref:Uncharacterized protein n=1 Tax=Aegilops tauschii subsp. strangulata TaxID=200361 RepID=A0A453Q396_AEGTS
MMLSFSNVDPFVHFQSLVLLQICNAVAIAEIMDATLILPVLKQDHMKRPDVHDPYNGFHGHSSRAPRHSR